MVVLLGLFGACMAEAGSQPGWVAAWGYNAYGQTDVPPGLTNVVAIAAGYFQSLALKADQTVVAWGLSNLGQTSVPPGLSNVVAIAAGYYHNLALKGDGTVVAWGLDNTNVPPGLSNMVAIAGGVRHSLALQSNGIVVAWGGDNDYGQTSVPPGLSNVVAIAAGYYHSLALKADGTVMAWGYNGSGRTDVPAGLSNVAAIAGGGSHSLALQSNGIVVAWGDNYYGQTNVPPGLSNVVAIAGGGNHSLALQSNGTVMVWGDNYYGQTNVPPGLSNVVAIAGGGNHSLAITLSPAIPSSLPAAISLALGAGTNLSVAVWSGSPFACQWSLNGLPMTGATGTSLDISNFDLTKAGVYSVVVTNPYGYATAATVLRLTNSPVVLVDGVDVGGGAVSRIDSSQVTMSSTFGSNANIYYTLDGSEPDFAATPYSGAFTLTNSANIRAIAYSFAHTNWAEAAPIYVQIAQTYPLSASTPGGGSISVSPAAYSGGNRYLSNAIVTLTATPSNGWSFVNWTGDSTATTDVTTVVMDQPRTVQAVFGTSLNLFTNGGGQLLLSPPTGPYAFGSTVQLTALPSPGYYFFGWSGAASGFANPLLFTITTASEITALFASLEANQVSLTVPVIGGGTVVVNPSKSVYTNGDMVTLTAVPATSFSGWSGDASGTLNPLVLTLNTSKCVTATFSLFGSLQVMLSPTGAVSAGAQWQLDGGPWQESGTTLSNLTVGAYAVSFFPVVGWITPSNQTVTVASGETTNLNETYVGLGNIQVTINPTNAATGGAQWALDGGPWQNSGTTLSNLMVGTHTVTFTNVAGWTTPTNQTVAVNLGQTTVVAAAYVQEFGNLQVTLSPAGAIILGAQWQLDNGPWRNSGATLTNIPVATHTVSFSAVPGWASPTNRQVVIAFNQTAHVSGIYQQQGAVQVAIHPAAAVIAGAQWQLDGGAWQNSGAVLANIPAASHTVSFLTISGWVTPAAQSVTVSAEGTNAVIGIYTGLGYSYATIAGTAGSSGWADGTNTTALFHTPVGITVDLQTNLYIADTGNSVIRRLTPTTNGWVSSTIAGLAGYPGNVDGTDTRARFEYPTGVAVDTNGNIYVADQVNSTVRRISPAGTNWVVSTIAGLAGNYGSANGTNDVARFHYPAGVAVDLAGNVYVADQINSTIRKLTPLGSNNWAVTTIAGTPGVNGSTDGTNSAARFYWPSDLSVDSSGNIFVADTFNNTIRKITPVGANFLVGTVCGMAGVNGSVDGTNSGALLDGPAGISLDVFGNLFVADSYSSVIRKITPVGTNWVVNTIGGWAYVPGTKDGTNSTARFNAPYGVCANAEGIIFVADTDNDTIRAGTPVYPPLPIPSLTGVNQTTNAFGFSWSAVSGLSYQVQYKTNLSQPDWSNLGSAILATNTTMTVSDPIALGPSQRWYRVALLP
jgi:hypothetical protein